jgi:hypothetical protein
MFSFFFFFFFEKLKWFHYCKILGWDFPGLIFLLQNGTGNEVKKIVTTLNEAEVPSEDVVGEFWLRFLWLSVLVSTLGGCSDRFGSFFVVQRLLWALRLCFFLWLKAYCGRISMLPPRTVGFAKVVLLPERLGVFYIVFPHLCFSAV